MLLLHCSFIVLLENSALFSQKRDFFFLQCRRMILCGMDNFHRLPCQNQTKQLQTRVPLVLKFSQIFDPFLLEKFAKKKCISRFTVVKSFSSCSRLTAWVDLDIYVFPNNVTNFKIVNNIFHKFAMTLLELSKEGQQADTYLGSYQGQFSELKRSVTLCLYYLL